VLARRGFHVLRCPVLREGPAEILDRYQDWRNAIPPGLADTATAQRIDDVLALRGLVEELDAADRPRGFGRD
jgi:hypothetical protein